MKLQTTLKLSALAIALGTSATTFAGYKIGSFNGSESTSQANGNIDITAGHSYTDRWNNPVNVGGNINLTADNKGNTTGGEINLDGKQGVNINGGSVGTEVTGNLTVTGDLTVSGTANLSGLNSVGADIVDADFVDAGAVNAGIVNAGQLNTQGIVIEQNGATPTSEIVDGEEAPKPVPQSVFKIKAAPAAPSDTGITPFVLEADDILDIDTDGNIDTAGNINSAGTISAKTMLVDGVDVGASLSNLNSRAEQLNRRIDNVEKTAYRGVAIALAAQQNVPNIKPGQFAVFGGVGHYEGESAGALGVVGAINDRTSLSAAFGIAGSNEVGGRVGVAYVFGGN